MGEFLDYCKQAEADYEQFIDEGKGPRQSPLIWEQDGDDVIDQATNTRFRLAEAMLAVVQRKVAHMGDGVIIWFGEPPIRIHFGTTGSA